MPHPTGFCVQDAPSSSVNASRLQSAESCETNVRPVAWSVKRIGSRVVTEVSVEPTLVHVAVPALLLKPDTRRVSRPAWNMTLPDDQLAPIDGSPESRPSAAGAAKLAKVGAVGAA